MGTVVIFFLFTAFYTLKMDAKLTNIRRAVAKHIREKRWSMSSQRLEQIIAEVMRPIKDLRASFNLDQSALLEEYLTEAGIHALDEVEASDAHVQEIVNFAELALLVQYSTFAYGRKVDLLHLNVRDYRQSLCNNTVEEDEGEEEEVAAAAGEEGATPAAGRRRRRASGPAPFAPLALQAWAGAAPGPGARTRPPPTLPRAFVELEPRPLGAAADRPLLDYQRQPVGVLSDFHVLWRLQDGMLVEELAQWADAGAARSPPLRELQAAIQAAAPPPLARPEPEPDPPPSDGDHGHDDDCRDHGHDDDCRDHGHDDASEAQEAPLQSSTPRRTERRARKRPGEPCAAWVKLLVTERMVSTQQFVVPARWVRRLLHARRRLILAARAALRRDAADSRLDTEFRGFYRSSMNTGGLRGFTAEEIAEASEAALRLRRPLTGSDDDGFHEVSSCGGSDDPAPAAAPPPEWREWQQRVAGAAGRSEARGLDLMGLARQLLDALAVLSERASRKSTACANQVVTNLSCDSGLGLDSSALDASADPARAELAASCAGSSASWAESSSSYGESRTGQDEPHSAGMDAPPSGGERPLVHCEELFAEAAAEPAQRPTLFLAVLMMCNAGNVEIEPGPPLTPNSFWVRLRSAELGRLFTAASETPFW